MIRFTVKIILTSLVLVSLVSLGKVQQTRPQTDRQIKRNTPYKGIFFNYDVYTFADPKSDSTRSFLVVSLVNDLLQFVKLSDSLYTAKFELSISIKDKLNNIIYMGAFRKQISVSDYRKTNSRIATHHYYHEMVLEPSEYSLRLELIDLDTKSSLKREKELHIHNFYDETIAFSQPVMFRTSIPYLDYKIEPFESKQNKVSLDIFNRMKYIMSPFKINNLKHYRLTAPAILYQEVYQKERSDSLKLTYRIITKNNETKWKKTEHLLSANQRRFSQRLKLLPQNFKPGFYILQIHAQKDTVHKRTQLRLFFNRNTKISATDSLRSKVDELGPMKYILAEDRYDQLNSLPKAERDSAISEFWEKRDPSEDDGVNELYQEFLRRVRFANQNFLSLIDNRKGWKTDQGRIYIVYGPPNEILHPQSPNSQYQHEIWIYDKIDQKRRFIFRFIPEKGEYQLLRGR